MTKGLFALVVVLAIAGIAGAHGATAARVQSNAIASENAKPGTSSWFIATPRQDEIAGYFDDVSYLPGDSATLSVDSHGDPFSYTVYRMGYYQGLGGRQVASGQVDANAAQPVPTVSDDFFGGAKLLTTDWQSSAAVQLGTNWVSGYYLVKLHDSVNGGESYANFVLRSATPAPIVINLATNTWQAYNLWGNLSLYRDSRLAPPITSESGVAHEVTFQRPYLSGWGAGMYFLYDRPLVEWAEENGYPVSYSTDEDVRQAREAGPQTKLVIFSGHEEYYSQADRKELLSLTARGVSQAFFGGNAWAWQARFNDTTHVMSVWRKKSLDPGTVPVKKTVRWEAVGLPQDALTGEMQTWGLQTGLQTAYATSSWPWNGAGVVGGADLGTLEGTEWDGIAVNTELPTNLLMLSRTPFSGMLGVPANQAMTLWQKTPSAFVFAAGQTGFNWNLSYPGVAPATWIDPHYPASSEVKPAIERLVGNLIKRATGIANPIAPIAPTGVAAPFALLAPQSGQDVKAAPSPLSVAWSDPPTGTAAIRVYVDGARVANRKPGAGNVLVTQGVTKLGPHTIRVVAVGSSKQILATLREPVIVLGANNATFRQNVNKISRLWGNDEATGVGARACFRMLPARLPLRWAIPVPRVDDWRGDPDGDGD